MTEIPAEDPGEAQRVRLSAEYARMRGQAEEALRESERLRQAIVGAGVGTWDLDLVSGSGEWSAEAMALLGARSSRFSAQDWMLTLHPEERESAREAWRRALEDGEPYELECRAAEPAPDGGERWILSRGRVERDASGRPLRGAGVVLDVTARRRAQQSLAELRARETACLEHLPVGVWFIGATGVIEYGNAAARQIWAGARFVGIQQFGEYKAWWHKSGEPIAAEQWGAARAIRTGEVCLNEEIDIECFDGTRRTILNSAVPVRGQDGALFGAVVFNQDITEHKRHERKLREGEERFRALFESMDEGSCSIEVRFDEAGKAQDYLFLDVNPAFERQTGLKDAKGKWMRSLAPEHEQAWFDIYGQVALTGVTQRFEGQAQALGRWYDVCAFRMEPAEDRRVGLLFNDITARKRSEEQLQKNRQQLEQLVEHRTLELQASHHRLQLAERMAALGTLAAGLGHDMGNLLVPVRVRLESLERMQLPPEARRDLEGIRASAGYLQKLTSGLRLLASDSSRGGTGEATELHAWWAEAEPVLRNMLPRGVVLRGEWPPEPCGVGIGRAALMQSVFNLVQNAADAMGAQGHGEVKVWGRCEESGVVLGVSDTGPGMSAEVRRRCMEPFFTTKTRGLSTGLGLALVYGIVREAGGTVEIQSAQGEGTTFILTLPARAVPSANQRPDNGKRARLDLADARVRAYVASELSARGFDVEAVEAEDPAELSADDLLVSDKELEPRTQARVLLLPPRAKISSVRSALQRAWSDSTGGEERAHG